MEQFYKLLNHINLQEDDDQLLVRYMSRFKYRIQGELMMHSLHSLEETFQLALKAKEKSKWSTFKKSEKSENFKDYKDVIHFGNNKGEFDHVNQRKDEGSKKKKRWEAQVVIGVVKMVIDPMNVLKRNMIFTQIQQKKMTWKQSEVNQCMIQRLEMT